MAIHNEDIARLFDELADLLEIENQNPFKVRAYRTGARTLRGLSREVAELVAEGQDLRALTGIGEALANKIVESLQTGKIKALEDLHRRLPASLEDLLHIPGLGPKRVRTLYQRLDIQDLDGLRQAAEAGRISALPGFGHKLEAHVLDAIAQRREKKQRCLRSVAMGYGEPLAQYLHGTEGVEQVVIAGSYRRGQDTVGDLDILITAANGAKTIDRFVAYEAVAEVLTHGATRATALLRGGLQVDVRVVPRESFGAALHYFTGNRAHNIQIRRRGQQRGLKINEYGVFADERRVAGETEESVFAAVDLPFIPPELREGRGEVEVAEAHALPDLVQLSQLRGDLHVHTRWSDGHADIRTMALAARRRGLRYIAITDHSGSFGIAHGLGPERLMAQWQEIDRLNAELTGITILKGCEVDILEDGSLDMPDAILADLDVVIGAVHTHLELPEKLQTERVLRAMDHPRLHILAHPSGRLLLERAPHAANLGRIVHQAKARGCCLELNSQPKRLDLDDVLCKLAKEEGVTVSINSDGHDADGFDDLALGIEQARRGWLGPHDILNTRPLAQLRHWLARA